MIQRGQGGIGKWVEQVANHLSSPERGLRLEIYVLREDIPLFKELGEQENVSLVSVSEIFRGAVMNCLWHQVVWPILALFRRIDIAHVPSYRRMPAWMPCPTVATIHDLAPFELSGKYDWMRNAYARHVVPWLARRMDHIVAVSEDTAAAVRRHLRVPESRISVLLNGLDPQFRKMDENTRCEAQESVAVKFGLGSKYWLYVSRLEHPGKNHCRLIEAFEIFCDRLGSEGDTHQLVLAGADWHGAEIIHQKIRSSLRHRQIVTTGYISRFEIYGLYSGCLGLTFASLWEGFGLPLVEAMAMGKPVMASGRGALGEVLGDAGIRTDVEDPHKMAEGMIEIIKDRDKREAMIRAGYRRADDFDWNHSADGLVGIYHQCHSSRIAGKQKQCAMIMPMEPQNKDL